MDKPNFKIGKYNVDFDVTEFLSKVMDVEGRKQEKDAICRLLVMLSKHEVELVRILTEGHGEHTRQMLEFFERRAEGYRDADRIRRFIRFWARRKLEHEAVRRAEADTREMNRELSFIHDENIRGLLSGRREAVRQLSGVMMNLMVEENPTLNLEGIRRFLGGEVS